MKLILNLMNFQMLYKMDFTVLAVAVNQIDSKSNSIGTKLDQCCASLNNKANKIQSKLVEIISLEEDIEECCAAVNSKIDELTAADQACCATIQSKLDQVVSSNEEAVECCAEVNSKMSVLQTTLDNCCTTVQSKLAALEGDVEEVEECCTDVNSKVTALQNSLTVCCTSVNSKLDVLLEGACSTITAPTTISAPGTYCLIVDIVGASPAILINSDNVLLDLGGKNIDNAGLVDVVGIRVAAGRQNITIRNGSISKSGAKIGSGIDLISGASSIRLENLFIKNWDRGINAASVTKLEVNDCQISGAADSGMLLNACSNISLENSLFANNAGSGIDLSGCASVALNNCSCNSNTENGLFIEVGTSGVHAVNCLFDGNTADGVLIQNSGCVEFIGCEATGNTDIPSGDGYHILSTNAPVALAANVLFKECIACGYTNGFHAEDVSNICIVDSVAKGNAINGFYVEGDASKALLRNNTSTGNTRAWFP